MIADGVTSLPFPPTAFGLVPGSWGGADGVGVVPTLDVHIYGMGTVELTDVAIYRGTQFPVVLADAALTDSDVNATTNAFHKVAHGYLTGDGPFPVTFDAGDAVTGLTDGSRYWFVKVDADHFKVAASVQDAISGAVIDIDYIEHAALNLGGLAAHNLDIVVEAILAGVGGEAITFDIVFDAAGVPTLSEVGNAVTLHVKNNVTTNGLLAAVINTSTKVRVKTDTATPAYVLQSATDNFAATALAPSLGSQGFTFSADDAERFYWSLLETVGTVELAAQLAVTIPIDHRPEAAAYAVVATFGGAVDVSVSAFPVVDFGG